MDNTLYSPNISCAWKPFIRNIDVYWLNLDQNQDRRNLPTVATICATCSLRELGNRTNRAPLYSTTGARDVDDDDDDDYGGKINRKTRLGKRVRSTEDSLGPACVH